MSTARLIDEFGRGPRIRILMRLKRSRGLGVRELAAHLRMSYMGVKQHCVELHQAGYLETWRKSRAEGRTGAGRPELLYRLTDKAHELFPAATGGFTLELLREAQVLYGPSAPEKLLMAVFRRRAEDLRARVRGETVERRARWLCREREAQGWLGDVVPVDGCLAIEEHHSPIQDLLERYPVLERFEQELVAEVLGVPVRREQQVVSGLYWCRFLTREPFAVKEALF